MEGFGPVVAGGLAVEFATMEDPAALGIERAEDDAPYSREADGGGAHRARLESHIKIVFRDALGVFLITDLTDDEDFGVGGRVLKLERAVAI